MTTAERPPFSRRDVESLPDLERPLVGAVPLRDTGRRFIRLRTSPTAGKRQAAAALVLMIRRSGDRISPKSPLPTGAGRKSPYGNDAWS